MIVYVALLLCGKRLQAESIPDQSGHDIVCSGPNFTYSHDVRQHGVDSYLAISGDAGFIIETGNPYASFYTDTTKSGGTAVYEYSFVAEPEKVFGDVSVASRASIYENGNIVIGEYKIGDGSWTEFLLLNETADIRPIDIIENVHDSHINIRYTLSWANAYWAGGVQLFRSWGPAPGQPGDFVFSLSASVVNDADCHKADLAGEVGEDVLIDLADFSILASDFGLTEADLAGDIDGNGSCDLADLKWLAEYWLCSCS